MTTVVEEEEAGEPHEEERDPTHYEETDWNEAYQRWGFIDLANKELELQAQTLNRRKKTKQQKPEELQPMLLRKRRGEQQRPQAPDPRPADRDLS